MTRANWTITPMNSPDWSHGSSAQVLTIEPNQVEGVEPLDVSAVQQPRELRFASHVEAHDLAVEDRGVSLERFSDRSGELGERLVYVAAP